MTEEELHTPRPRPPLGPDAGDDDPGLVAAMARGDRAALGQLYDRHASLLLALGLRVLGDRAVAEDVLHDVFLEAWHHAREFDPARGTVRAWLVTRMRSRSLDRRAATARQARLTDEAGRQVDSITPAADSPPGLDSARLRSQIAGMPAELAALIDLAYFEGLSSSQIAARLDIPVGTVKSRMARALSVLRQNVLAQGGRA
jgi:RNA polymerase sigma-70 factor, ECF subfamily